jgi:hypothetical protein
LLFFPLGANFGELNPPFHFCSVVASLFHDGLQLIGVLPHVLEFFWVMFFSFGAISGELNPPIPVVLLMIFFLVA